MEDWSLNVLYEDDDTLVVNKPSGLVCHPGKFGPSSCLVGRIRHYLGSEAAPELVHRLDRETSGVLMLGKHASGARQLRELWETGLVTKEYLALVHGHLHPSCGQFNESIGPALGSPVAVQDAVRPDGRPACTLYWVEKRWLWQGQHFSKVRLRLATGRKHQIRIHLAHAGCPIVGDKLYGGDPDIYLALVEKRLTSAHRSTLLLSNQALHAVTLWVPWMGEEREFSVPPEPDFLCFEQGKLPPWREDPYGPPKTGTFLSSKVDPP